MHASVVFLLTQVNYVGQTLPTQFPCRNWIGPLNFDEYFQGFQGDQGEDS
jgi:hypothetical protein